MSKCDCFIDAHPTGRGDEWIEYCPMHDAAPDLLALLEEIVINCRYNSPQELRAKAAIAKARGE